MVRLLIIIVFCAFSTSAFSQAVGTAVDVKGQAEVTLNGESYLILSGDRVSDGAEITTGADGTVQLTFDDGTNIVVGQSSTLKISEVLMTTGNVASRFAVNAVSGGFRFITGNSPKENYEIETPKATMGVRGTEFDLSVNRASTTLVLFDGAVRMCRGNNRCAIVRGSCAVARTGFFTPVYGVGGTDAGTTLTENFPFFVNQEQLRQNFRTSSRGCSRYFAAVPRSDPLATPKLPSPPPLAPPAPPPASPAPPPAPPAPPPSEFPGQSGEDGPSQGRGGGASAGQDGSGTGSGQGSVHRNSGHNGTGRGNSGKNGR